MRRVRRPLHHASRGPPPPLSRVRIARIVLAARLRARVLQNLSREARSRGGREYEGWRLVVSLFATPVSPIPNTVARIERSEIRERSTRSKADPGFASLNPGYEVRRKEAERRQALILYPPHHRVRLCPGEGTARLPAFHHGSRQRESSSLGLSFRPGFLGRGLHGRYPPSPVPVQGSTSQPGHNAGRRCPETPREQGVWPHPQAPHSPHPRRVPSAGGVLGERVCIGAYISH